MYFQGPVLLKREITGQHKNFRNYAVAHKNENEGEGMRALRAFVLSIVFIISMLLTGCGGGGSSATASTPTTSGTNVYFPASVGFTWTYNVTSPSANPYTVIETVNQVSASGFSTTEQASNGTLNETINYSYTNSTLEISSYIENSTSLTYTYTPAAIVLPADMTVGSSASTTSSLLSNNVTNSSILRNITIDDDETITVPAGIFTARKATLTINTTPVSGQPSQMIYNYWYVDNIGKVKTEFYNANSPTQITTWEMASYSL